MRIYRMLCLRSGRHIGDRCGHAPSILMAMSALFASLPPSAGAADSPWLYGIHWFGPTSNNSDVNSMTGNKKIWVLETVMTAEGFGQWGPQGQLTRLQYVAAQGHTLIIRVQPVWGKAFPLPTDTNPSMAQFLEQVTQLATLYKDICHIWHLGNEMNLYMEWANQVLTPEAYIDAAVQFSDRIKAVASTLGPQIVLVGPAAVGASTNVAMHTPNTEYLTRMCNRINALNAGSKFDGFALHAYAKFEPDLSDDLNTNLAYFETQPGYGYQHQIGIIDSKGFTDKSIFITEWNRYTGSSPGEAVSATFLHNALARIHAWNQANHPVVAACWFIYPKEASWEGYSILQNKSSGNENQDLWHAFQYACTKNYPAGAIVLKPRIELAPVTITRTVTKGLNPANDSFTIKNTGAATLSYTITDNANWLSQSPSTGTATSETDTITILYSATSLPVGTHTATISVSDANAANSPQTISVTLHVRPVYGDFDNDGDVDQTDFGIFQRCMSGPGVTQTAPNCLTVMCDSDDDVDLDDFAGFQSCMSGPNIPANPACSICSPHNP